MLLIKIKGIENAKIRLAEYVAKKQVTFVKANFRELTAELRRFGVTEVDGILYDLEFLHLNWMRRNVDLVTTKMHH